VENQQAATLHKKSTHYVEPCPSYWLTVPAFNATTPELSQQLRVSDSTLRRLRLEGALKPGVHFRALGSGTKRPPLLWNVEAVDQALAQRSRRVLSA
jgi:hypothetical protein